MSRKEADQVSGTVVPQAKETAKVLPAEAMTRPQPAPMAAAQRLSVIWLREARKP